MNIAVLGGGVEGKAVKKYFEEKGDHVQIFDNFSDKDLETFKLEDYDKIFRSPSVHPPFILEKLGINLNIEPEKWASITNYFFENCPAKIIGVTGTKGKGTISSLITHLLQNIINSSEWKSRKVHLLGNFGVPAIEKLDEISTDDVVVFELSSFQLWDLKYSPSIAVIGRIEPDHLDRHLDFDDYVAAKSNIVKYQTENDVCIYYKNNTYSEKIADAAVSKKVPYDISSIPKEILDSLNLVGNHNKENAAAAIIAVSEFLHQDLNTFLEEHKEVILSSLKNFKGLPHRIEYVTTKNNVDYYDDNYSSAFPALDVALSSFKDRPLVLIAGGKDRHLDLSKMKDRIFRETKNLKKVILIGETAGQLSEDEDPEKYILADTLEDAVNLARKTAEKIAEDVNSNYDLCIPTLKNPKNPVVLMSPGAASFDMFKDFNERGEKFKELVL